MASHSRKANPLQDVEIFLIVQEVRAAWQIIPKYEKRGGETYWERARDVLASTRYRINFKDDFGIRKAYKRGERVLLTQNFTTRKTGRHVADPWDLLEQLHIYELVRAAVAKGYPLQQAYGLAGKGLAIERTPRQVKHIYCKIRAWGRGSMAGIPPHWGRCPKGWVNENSGRW